jgi:hypothetical protein
MPAVMSSARRRSAAPSAGHTSVERPPIPTFVEADAEPKRRRRLVLERRVR